MRATDAGRANSGMSLLEVLIALAILAFGLLGLAALQVTAIKGNATANETVAATYYAQEEMERLRRTAFDNVLDSPGILAGPPKSPDFASIPTNGSVESTTTKKGIRVYRVWAVETTTATLKTITVWSCWRDEKNSWRTVRLVTRKGNIL